MLSASGRFVRNKLVNRFVVALSTPDDEDLERSASFVETSSRLKRFSSFSLIMMPSIIPDRRQARPGWRCQHRAQASHSYLYVQANSRYDEHLRADSVTHGAVLVWWVKLFIFDVRCIKTCTWGVMTFAGVLAAFDCATGSDTYNGRRMCR